MQKIHKFISILKILLASRIIRWRMFGVLASFMVIALVLLGHFSYHLGYGNGAAEWNILKNRSHGIEAALKEIKAENRELRQEVFKLQQLVNLEQVGKEELVKNLKILQYESEKLKADNTLYRKIMGVEYKNAGIHINSLQIYPSKKPQRFRYSVLLAKYSGHKKTTAGELSMSLQGVLNNEVVHIPFQDLTAESVQSQPFKCRYFKALTGELELPEGFQPELLLVDVVSKDNKTIHSEEEFPWIVTDDLMLPPQLDG